MKTKYTIHRVDDRRCDIRRWEGLLVADLTPLQAEAVAKALNDEAMARTYLPGPPRPPRPAGPRAYA